MSGPFVEEGDRAEIPKRLAAHVLAYIIQCSGGRGSHLWIDFLTRGRDSLARVVTSTLFVRAPATKEAAAMHTHNWVIYSAGRN